MMKAARASAKKPERGNIDFARLAGSYEKWYETPAGRACDDAEKRVVARLLPQAPGANRLLEVGCGTGHWSAFFSEHGFEVTGVDISPEMIERAAAADMPRASFRVADAHMLPFADEAFDVAAAITTLEFVRDAEEVLAEMARCTVKGGTLIIGALNALAAINIERKRAGKHPWADARFFSPEELEKLLRPFGKPQIELAVFFRRSAPFALARLRDCAGRFFGGRRGAFIAAKVQL